MAIFTDPGNVLTTYDIGFFGQGGIAASGILNHEDLTDVLTILDSFQTPFFSGAPKLRAKDVVHSWPIDALAAPSSAGRPDGMDYGSGDAITPPKRLFNMVQTFNRNVTVSDREREANPAGIADIYTYQVTKKFKEIARDFEFTAFRSQRSGSGASATGAESPEPSSGAIMAGFQGLFASASIFCTGASAATGFTTGDLVDLCTNLFVRGGEPDSVWFAPDTKKQFVNAVYGTGTVGGLVRNIAADDKRIVANVEVFETPYNQLLAVVTDRFIPMASASGSGCAYFVGDRSMARVAFFRPPQHKQIAKSGDNTKGMILMDATLHIDHPSSWGMVTGVTGTVTGLV
jgi:hypothetical protein